MNLITCFLLFLCILAPEKLLANELNCSELKSAIGMVHANSIGVLNKYRSTAGKSYRSNVIYSFKYFELMGSDARGVAMVFKVLPANDQQYTVWITMGDSFCQGEKLADMALMDSFGERLPLLLSRAVIDRPSEMSKYIKFSLNATQDPHSKIVFGMRNVCLIRHSEFKEAIGNLSHSDKEWITSHIIRIDSCRPIELPESD